MRDRDVEVLDFLRKRRFLSLFLLEFLTQLELLGVKLADADFELDNARL